jgi:hypothetical protein
MRIRNPGSFAARSLPYLFETCNVGVVDCFDAHPDWDQTSHFDADPDTDPTLNYTHVGKSETFLILLTSSASLHCFIFLVSRQRHRCHNFQYFGQYIEIFWKKV